MKPLVAAATLCLVSLGAAPARSEPMVPIDVFCDYKMFFMEEFNTLKAEARVLGSARWTAHTPWNGDFGDAAFGNPAPDGPFTIKDGILRITATKAPTGKWRSGLLAAADGSGAGFGLRYGYFEARMRLPPGPGTWPAFWLAALRPNTETGPALEVDVIEYYGQFDNAYSAALHVWYKGADKDKSRHKVQAVPIKAGTLITGFHRYGVRVAPDFITYYFDRRAVWQMPTPPEHQKPLFPLVNLALGSGWPIDKTPDPSVLEVDWVHVWSPDPDGRARRCPAKP